MQRSMWLAFIVVSLAVSGCLIGEDRDERERSGDESETLVSVGGGEDTGEDTDGFDSCEENLEPEGTYAKDGDHLIQRFYWYKKNSCILVSVGHYNKITRATMLGKMLAGGEANLRSSGSFDAAVRFMRQNGITCEAVGKKLKFIFPKHRSDRTGDYKEIEIECSPQTKAVVVAIGLDSPRDRTLAITISERKKDSSQLTTYHAFDTNNKGEIIKHVKVVGDGKREKVLLER